MQRKASDLPMHMYHRIYRFARRNIDAERIAVTLDLPLKTVQKVLDRFAQAQEQDEEALIPGGESGEGQANDKFLDVYIVPKVRFVVADISGYAIEEFKQKLQEELDKLARSQWRVVALLMRDVLAMDEQTVEIIISFHDKLANRGRYSAILDPSGYIENFIQEQELDEKIPIFGTEKTFEETAFSRRSQKKNPGPMHG